jgi:hypothetical protein
MKRPRIFLLVLTAALVFVAAQAFTQDKALAVGTDAPQVDGVVKAGEYAVQKDYGSMQISLSRTADTLFVGAVGGTTGWIAVGLDSQKMDGATIFMGFVGEDGKVQLKPQAGSGHKHSDVSDKAVADSVISYAIKESKGKTTLEVAVKAETYIQDGQKSLDLIFAIGPAKSFSPYHIFRGSQSVALAQ